MTGIEIEFRRGMKVKLRSGNKFGSGHQTKTVSRVAGNTVYFREGGNAGRHLLTSAAVKSTPLKDAVKAKAAKPAAAVASIKNNVQRPATAKVGTPKQTSLHPKDNLPAGTALLIETLPGGIERCVHVFTPAVILSNKQGYQNQRIPLMAVRSSRHRYAVMRLYQNIEILGPSELRQIKNNPLRTGTGGQASLALFTTAPIRITHCSDRVSSNITLPNDDLNHGTEIMNEYLRRVGLPQINQ